MSNLSLRLSKLSTNAVRWSGRNLVEWKERSSEIRRVRNGKAFVSCLVFWNHHWICHNLASRMTTKVSCPSVNNLGANYLWGCPSGFLSIMFCIVLVLRSPFLCVPGFWLLHQHTHFCHSFVWNVLKCSTVHQRHFWKVILNQLAQFFSHWFLWKKGSLRTVGPFH